MYKRILLKLSGEVLAGEQGHGIDFDMVTNVCTYVKKVADMGDRSCRRRRKLLAWKKQRHNEPYQSR